MKPPVFAVSSIRSSANTIGRPVTVLWHSMQARVSLGKRIHLGRRKCTCLVLLIAKYSPQVLHASPRVTRGRSNACTNGSATHVTRVESLRDLLEKAQVRGDC